MTTRLLAWECVGCGRIEGPRPCVGVCEDRRTAFVYAADYDVVLAQLGAARNEAQELRELMRQIAHTTPRQGECERTWLALRARAARLLQKQDVA